MTFPNNPLRRLLPMQRLALHLHLAARLLHHPGLTLPRFTPD